MDDRGFVCESMAAMFDSFITTIGKKNIIMNQNDSSIFMMVLDSLIRSVYTEEQYLMIDESTRNILKSSYCRPINTFQFLSVLQDKTLYSSLSDAYYDTDIFYYIRETRNVLEDGKYSLLFSQDSVDVSDEMLKCCISIFEANRNLGTAILMCIVTRVKVLCSSRGKMNTSITNILSGKVHTKELLNSILRMVETGYLPEYLVLTEEQINSMKEGLTSYISNEIQEVGNQKVFLVGISIEDEPYVESVEEVKTIVKTGAFANMKSLTGVN